MNRNSLTTAVVAGIAGVVGIANLANAVNLNPDGLGQVLLYPYYTVNNHQQTALSVVNTTSIGKAVKVRFLEGYNSREVLDFNLFLSPFDVWTAGVFSLSDAGVSGSGAGIFTKDNSCTAPQFLSGPLANGAGYQAFLHYAYTGSNSDSGPTGDSRTREGHFEMISMGDITGAALAADITHVNGKPPGCLKAEADFEAGAFASIVAPTSGLFGAAAVVDVANGTYYAYNADALDGFTQTALGAGTGSLTPSLAGVNEGASPTVMAHVFNNGAVVNAAYTKGGTTGIDAVSAVFSANNLYNQWQAASDGSVGSDWVVTFPTKRFYVDTLYTGGAGTAPIIPFESAFVKGLSCDVVGISLFDREENTTSTPTCGFSPCPPGQPPSSLCHETNVISFGGTSILGSGLTSNIATSALGSNGWLGLSFTDATHGGTSAAADAHASRPSVAGTSGTITATAGVIFYGLPVTGFEAEDFVNGNLNGVLANYSGVYRHRNSRCASTGAGPCS